MKWLQTLLAQLGVEQETTDKIMEESKKQNMIPKERFDSVNTQLKEANQTLANVNTELETLKTSAQSSEILKQQLADLQKKNTDLVNDYEGKMKEMKIQDFIKEEMSKTLIDQKYFGLLYKEVDHSKLTVKDDGAIEGFDLKVIQDKYPDLFSEPENPLGSPGKPPTLGAKGNPEESMGAMLAKLGKSNTVEKNPYF